jgi:phosphoglycolate phosphatase-like HAD superfamily hydrolase
MGGLSRQAIHAVIFDFDGVLAESVSVKLDAYVALFAAEGSELAARIRTYCLPRLGLSRFRLIDAIQRDVLQRELSPGERERLLTRYGALVVDRVVAAPLVEGAAEFIAAHAGRYRFFVVSGTPHEELQEILRRRGMADWFEAAYGSPATKDALLRSLVTSHGWQPDQVVYVGDTAHDWEAVRTLQMPFVWRRHSAEDVRPDGFTGPAINTLVDLAACLERARDPRGQHAV